MTRIRIKNIFLKAISIVGIYLCLMTAIWLATSIIITFHNQGLAKFNEGAEERDVTYRAKMTEYPALTTFIDWPISFSGDVFDNLRIFKKEETSE